MFDRRPGKYFDWGLLSITLLLGCLGLIILYSAVTAGVSVPQKVLCGKQMIWFCIGMMAMIISFLVNYKVLDQWGIAIFFICIVLLIGVLIFGKYVGGSRRWLTAGPITMQPSELVKIGIVIILARYYAKHSTSTGLTLKQLFSPILITLIPFVLIVKQPDLGTALLIFLIAASMTVFVKIERRAYVYIIGACMITGPLIWRFILKGYQKQRILTFINPELDPLGSGYHIIQSKIAIGSGMLFGKGFLKGTQNALSFLPEQHTDFIISVLAEEWGLVGTGLVLFIYLLLIVWGLNIAQGCRDAFGTILSFGVTAMIFWQVFINAGMVMGLMPVVGVPLPLISYGGSSVVTTLIGIGILMNVSMRRYIIE